MKTKVLIEKLKELDPEGNIEVCVNDEAIHFVERLEGYWDGCYLYFDESQYFPNKIYVSDKGDKIRINTMSLKDYLWNVDGDDSKIDFTNVREYRRDRFDWIEEEKKEIKKLDQEMNNEFFFGIMTKIRDGYEIVQDKNKELGSFHVMYWRKDGQETSRLCQGECKVVLDFDFFEPVFENNDYIWKFTFKYSSDWRKKAIKDIDDKLKSMGFIPDE